jgi:hypothetical protein
LEEINLKVLADPDLPIEEKSLGQDPPRHIIITIEKIIKKILIVYLDQGQGLKVLEMHLIWENILKTNIIKKKEKKKKKELTLGLNQGLNQTILILKIK